MAENKDQFANFAILTTVESAANTLTFKKLETGISLNEKVAWVIARIEYFLSPITATQFAQTDDMISFGLSVSSAFSVVTLAETTILDLNTLSRLDTGTAANSSWFPRPFIKDFSSLPAGGIIVPPTPLYGYVQGTGLAAVATSVARIFYTLRTLKVEDYWELVEARRVLSS